MGENEKRELEKEIMDILTEHKGKTEFYIAYKIVKEVIEPLEISLKDRYERLFFVDTSNKN